jgi:chromosome segregation ATPase
MTWLSDDEYRRTEGMLYRYADRCSRIERLEAEIAEYDKQLADLQRQLEYWLGYNPRLTGNYDLTGALSECEAELTPVERALMDVSTRRAHLQELWLSKRSRRDQLQERVNELRLAIIDVECALKQLTQVEIQVFEQRYIYRRNNSQIGQALKYSEGTIRRIRANVVKVLATALLDDVHYENITNSRRKDDEKATKIGA